MRTTRSFQALLSILAIMCVGGGYKAQLKLVDFGVAKELNEIAQSIDLLNNVAYPYYSLGGR